jgi:hypothetical protein
VRTWLASVARSAASWRVPRVVRSLSARRSECSAASRIDRFRYDFRRVAKPLLQVRGDGQIRRIDNQTRVRQSLIPRQAVISSTNGSGGGSARRGQCLEAKAGEKLGGADIPWIRNDEGAWAVVKRAEASRLFVLRDTHKSYLPIRSPHSTDSLSYTAGLSPSRTIARRWSPTKALTDRSFLVG